MANYQDLKNNIAKVIRTNGNQEITGQLLQNTLHTMVSVMGANCTFAGIATPYTDPGAPDQNVFYLAAEKGTYVNFNGLAIIDGEIAALIWLSGSWSKASINVASVVDSRLELKADKAELAKALTGVDSKLELKADKANVKVELAKRVTKDVFIRAISDLDDKLNLKADNTYVDGELERKADKADVDSKLDAVTQQATRNSGDIDRLIEAKDRIGRGQAIGMDTQEWPTLCGLPMTIFANEAPSKAPDFAGQQYLDLTNKKAYVAFGVGSVSDWAALN